MWSEAKWVKKLNKELISHLYFTIHDRYMINTWFIQSSLLEIKLQLYFTLCEEETDCQSVIGNTCFSAFFTNRKHLSAQTLWFQNNRNIRSSYIQFFLWALMDGRVCSNCELCDSDKYIHICHMMQWPDNIGFYI